MDYIEGLQKMPNKPKVKVVENTSEHGLYVWKMENGKVFGDGDGSFMNIPARKYPDEFDTGAFMDAAKGLKTHGDD